MKNYFLMLSRLKIHIIFFWIGLDVVRSTGNLSSGNNVYSTICWILTAIAWTSLCETLYLDTCIATVELTELVLRAAPMQVDPQFAIDVVLDARILLVVESIEGPAHHRIHLHPRSVIITVAQHLAIKNPYTTLRQAMKPVLNRESH